PCPILTCSLIPYTALFRSTVVTEQLLRESKLVRGNVAGVKILGNGELKHALKIEADKISASARTKIDKVGGTIALRENRPPENVNRKSTRLNSSHVSISYA